MIDEMHTDSYNDKPRRTRRRLHIEYLISLIGYEPAIRFCLEYAGCPLPPRDRVLRFVRRQSIVADHLHHSLPLRQLAGKYKMTPGVVRKIINEHLEAEREMKKLNDRLEAIQARRRNREAG